MSREGLPTRLISAAPPRVLDLLTSLWRRMSFDVRVCGRCWEDPSRTLRCQRLSCCAELRLLPEPSSPDSSTNALALLTEHSIGAVGTEPGSHFKVHRHHRAAESCSSGTPCVHAIDISEYSATLIGCIAAWSTEDRLAKLTIRAATSVTHRHHDRRESTITPQDSPNCYELCKNLFKKGFRASATASHQVQGCLSIP